MSIKWLWPDLTIDQKAWEMAKAHVVEGESLSKTIERANEFKKALQKAGPHA